MAKNLWQDDKMTPENYGEAPKMSMYGKSHEFGWRAPREYVAKLEQHRDLSDEMIKEHDSVVEQLLIDVKMCNDSFKEISDLSIKAHQELIVMRRELGKRNRWLIAFVSLSVALILATAYHYITHA